uniref:WAP domain-containing protein n=1 Tax=Pyxicephalus adspersus TaxID=30357 RepID=A0AAV3AS19_PYXAD|nr:TPA: hypothetical protein GDO54_008259 [Pyxicephalus adspersus]
MNSIQVSLLGLLLSLATLTTANNVKPGVCPPERFLDYQNYPVHEFCQNDKDCSGNQKCCVDNKFKFCKPPAGERSGSCPSENTLIRQRCDDECTSDNECASGAKCCFRECGKRCLPLVGGKRLLAAPPGCFIACNVEKKSRSHASTVKSALYFFPYTAGYVNNFAPAQ